MSFGILTPSRHPANQNGYDPELHRYRPEYVNPQSWGLSLSFLPRGSIENPPGQYRIPPDIQSIGFTVKLAGGPVIATIDKELAPFRVETEVLVPQPGEYEISLLVRYADGSQASAGRNYRLRDFLIVGIGDSFASGQGNPDVPAIPAPDQQAWCKATSIALIATKVTAFLTQFYQEYKQDVETVIDHLPFAGKIVMAVANRVGDILGFVDSGADDLRDWAVQVGRDAEADLVHAGEEVLSWFGIGDGGNSNQPRAAAWQEPRAYRSYRSGQSLAAAKAETVTSSGADRITFLALGRTGSEVDNGLLGPRTIDGIIGPSTPIDKWTQNRGQVEEARDTAAGRSVDAVVISIGINDLGFSSLVTNSILSASGTKRKQRIAGAKRKIAVKLPAELDQLKQVIDSALSPRMVLITEYPVGVFKEIADGAPPCGVLASSIPNYIGRKGFDSRYVRRY